MEKKLPRSIFLIVMVIGLVGCTLPTIPAPTSPSLPTPNRTMTALFATPMPTQPLPTRTLPGVITATQPAATGTPPSPTAVQPSPTLQSPTSMPSPTPTGDTSRRPGSTITANKVSGAPAIDGDWNDLPTKEYPAEIVVFGKNNWENEADLRASFKIGWDATYLYIGVKIFDDKYVQNATGEDIFKGDSVEILLDANVSGDFYDDTLSGDDFQLGFSPGKPDVNGTRQAYLWLPAGSAGVKSAVKIAATRTDSSGLTRVEAAVPWSLFGVTPKSGLHLGFALSVSDNDTSGTSIQETMVSSAKDRDFLDPTTWGDLMLK